MKKSIILLALLMPVLSFAAVGEHNITANIGGAFNAAFTVANDTSDWGGEEAEKDYAWDSEYLGGGYSVELGYLWLKQGTMVHGVDVRLGFGQNFGSPYKQWGKP